MKKVSVLFVVLYSVVVCIQSTPVPQNDIQIASDQSVPVAEAPVTQASETEALVTKVPRTEAPPSPVQLPTPFYDVFSVLADTANNAIINITNTVNNVAKTIAERTGQIIPNRPRIFLVPAIISTNKE